MVIDNACLSVGHHIVIGLVQVVYGYCGYQWLSVVIRCYQWLSVVIAWLSVVLDCLSNVSIDSVHDYIQVTKSFLKENKHM